MEGSNVSRKVSAALVADDVATQAELDAQNPGRLIGQQIFTASGTYTPTPGTTSIVVEVQAPGGGSGGCVATTAGQWTAGRPGAGGAYARKRITSGFAGTVVTIGAPGTAGTAGDNGGGSGNATTFGAHVTCNGGAGGGGSGSVQTAANIIQTVAVGGTATGGDINIPGGAPAAPFSCNGTVVFNPAGGASFMSNAGANRTVATNNQGGQTPAGYGAGASGPALSNAVFSASVGAVGGPGIVIVWEYA